MLFSKMFNYFGLCLDFRNADPIDSDSCRTAGTNEGQRSWFKIGLTQGVMLTQSRLHLKFFMVILLCRCCLTKVWCRQQSPLIGQHTALHINRQRGTATTEQPNALYGYPGPATLPRAGCQQALRLVIVAFIIEAKNILLASPAGDTAWK